MKDVYLVLDGSTVCSKLQVQDISQFLMQQFGGRGSLPDNVRIYHQGIGSSNDVTPTGDRPGQVELRLRKLRALPGPFYVVQHPGGPESWGALLVAVVVAAVAAAVLLRPKLPNTLSKNQALESPNNSLSERTNEPRVNGRIPCIVGHLRSTPDLLMPPYFIYTDNVKREVAYMCIGEGTYQIHDVRDDATPIGEISGSSAEIYGPNTSPNSGAPQLRVGDAINIPLLIPKRIDSVNGQTLLPNDAGSIVRNPMRFQYPNQVLAQGGVDFTEVFVPGDTINLSEAFQTDGLYTYSPPIATFLSIPSNQVPTEGRITFAGNHSTFWQVGQVMTITNGTVFWTYYDGGDGPSQDGNTNLNGIYQITAVDYDSGDDETTIRIDISTNNQAWAVFNRNVRTSDVTGSPTLSRPSDTVQFDLSGTYTIVTVTGTVLTLNNPSAVNPDWEVMNDDYGGLSNVLYPILSTAGDRWIGWFTVRFPRPVNRLIANFVAPGGMYALSGGGNQRSTNVSIRIEAQRVDANGNPFGAVHAFERTIVGSATTRAERAITINEELVNTPNNAWRFRARRLTPTDHDFDGEMVTEVVWNDLYAASNVDVPHFGDVTTAYTVTSATSGATSIKNRRFNTLVTRMIPLRISGDQFTTDLHPTVNAAEIMSFLALDPNNGRRTKDQIDFDSIYNARAAVVDYFGTELAGNFSYTFDSDTLSFEEMLTQVAQAMFCQAYRRGSKIRLYFERQTDHRAMLFNHRNVLPGTEEHSGSFGTANSEGSDGVEYQWWDPVTDATANIVLPEDGSALNPLKIESVGVRNNVQAHFHAWREFQKIRYQRRSKTFDSLHMANLLIPKNVVLCTDGTRPETVAGEVVSVNGLVLELDQTIDWSNGTDHHIFLQVPEVSVDSIPISPGPTATSVTLSRAPISPVMTGGMAAFNTSYTIISTTNSGTLRPYIVAEKSDKQNMVVGMQVVEYTDRIYDHDKDFINGIIQER